MKKLKKKPVVCSVHDVIAIGDVAFDTFLPIKEATVGCDINREHCMISMSYADKIAIGKPVHIIAGNAANNVVGSARLGLKAAFYSILGSDDIGKRVLRKLEHEGVQMDYVRIQKGSETNSSYVLSFLSERTILIYHVARNYVLPKLKSADWIYLTSLGKKHLALHAQIVVYLGQTGARLAFNPGTHQLKDGLRKLRPILAKTDVLFVNKEEAQRLVGNIEDMKKLLIAVRRVGPKIVVITDGTNGSFAHNENMFWKIGITDTPVVGRTGAGDAFGTAFTAALHYGKSIPEALRWGTMNSASVITKVGPEAGLLNKKQMAAWLRKYPKPVVETF